MTGLPRPQTTQQEDDVARLEELRRRRALSQEELAQRAGVSTRTIYNIERAGAGGTAYSPRGKVMRGVAAVFGVEPEAIDEFRAALGLSGNPSSEGAR
ncbi:MAG: helix-turn-helix transcriptional regulator [Chloroflexota bacterium]